MKLNDYQSAAEKFHKFKSPQYPYYALAEETGEFLGKIAKLHRGDFMGSMDEFDISIKKELGDVLWNVAAIASVHGWTLESVAEMNLDKLTDRAKRDVISGEGDDR